VRLDAFLVVGPQKEWSTLGLGVAAAVPPAVVVLVAAARSPASSNASSSGPAAPSSARRRRRRRRRRLLRHIARPASTPRNRARSTAPSRAALHRGHLKLSSKTARIHAPDRALLRQHLGALCDHSGMLVAGGDAARGGSARARTLACGSLSENGDLHPNRRHRQKHAIFMRPSVAFPAGHTSLRPRTERKERKKIEPNKAERVNV